MKKFYFTLIIIALGCFTTAQVINIPDVNFKNLLVSSSTTGSIARDINNNFIKVDINNNGEIEVSEVLPVYKIIFGGGTINFVSDYTGISYFQNLRIFNISNVSGNPQINVPSLDFTGLINLTHVNCYNNNVQNLTIAGLSNLQILNCDENNISTLNFTGLSSLVELRCSNNLLTNLDVTTLPALNYLTCHNNLLTNLNVNNLSNLTALFCYNNQLETLSLNGLTSLQIVHCYNNLLTTMDFSANISLNTIQCYNNDLTNINLNGLVNLTSLYCRNNNLLSLEINSLSSLVAIDCSFNSLSTLNANGLSNLLDIAVYSNSNLTSIYIKDILYSGAANEYFLFSNNPNLTYICTNDNKIPLVQGLVDGYGYTNCVVDSNCTLSNNQFNAVNEIAVYPNPVNTVLHIDIKNEINEIEIYNLLGQLIIKSSNKNAINDFDVSFLKQGIYVLKVYGENYDKAINFIKN